MRGMMLAMSQEKLGDALGVTFQQVQKYEKAPTARRLQQISHVLQAPVAFFLDGASEGSAPDRTTTRALFEANRALMASSTAAKLGVRIAGSAGLATD